MASTQVGTAVTCSDCLEEFIASPAAKVPREPSAAEQTHGDRSDNDALQRLLNPNLESEQPEGETLRLDVDLGADDEPGSSPKRQVLTKEYAFSFQCPICRTRIDLTDKEVGTRVKCPDCYSEHAVREPAPNQRRAKNKLKHSDDDEFRLVHAPAAVKTPEPFQSIADDLLKKAEAELPPRPIRPVSSEGSDALQRAEEEVVEDEATEPPLPASPFKDGLFKFLLDPNTIGRLVFLAGGLFILLGAIQIAITTTDEGAIQQFMSVLMRMFAVTFGVAFLAASCTSMQGILQDTSNGIDEIISWPDLNFLDWFGEMLFILSGLFISVVPFVILAKLVSTSAAASWAITLGGSSVGLIFAFPMILLSVLETGSPINPISRPIQRSLRLARAAWLKFTFLAVFVVGTAGGLALLRIRWPDYVAMNLGIATGLMLLSAIYFRLLGRLAWCCRVAIADEDTRLEELLADQEA
ncbi:MAG: hypothetical protein CMJ64_06000 [Planctomycetaceae bacterium]|nr:hypothetical protein [Planctomycetaceae bacterium]